MTSQTTNFGDLHQLMKAVAGVFRVRVKRPNFEIKFDDAIELHGPLYIVKFRGFRIIEGVIGYELDNGTRSANS